MLKTAHVFRAQSSLRLKAKPRYPQKSPTLTAISLITEYLIAWNPHISNYIYRVISLKAQTSFHFPSWFLNIIQNTYHNIYIYNIIIYILYLTYLPRKPPHVAAISVQRGWSMPFWWLASLPRGAPPCCCSCWRIRTWRTRAVLPGDPALEGRNGDLAVKSWGFSQV